MFGRRGHDLEVAPAIGATGTAFQSRVQADAGAAGREAPVRRERDQAGTVWTCYRPSPEIAVRPAVWIRLRWIRPGNRLADTPCQFSTELQEFVAYYQPVPQRPFDGGMLYQRCNWIEVVCDRRES